MSVMEKPLILAGFAFIIIVTVIVADGIYGIHTKTELNGKSIEPTSENQVWLGEYLQNQKMILTVSVVNNTFSQKTIKKPSVKIYTMPQVKTPESVSEWEMEKEFLTEGVMIEPFQKKMFTYEFSCEWRGQYRILIEGEESITINFNVW